MDCAMIANNSAPLGRLLNEIMSHDEDLLRARKLALDEIETLETLYTNVPDFHKAEKTGQLLVASGLATRRKDSGFNLHYDLLLVQLKNLVLPEQMEPVIEEITRVILTNPHSRVQTWFPPNLDLTNTPTEGPLILDASKVDLFNHELETVSENYLSALNALKDAALLIDLFKNSQPFSLTKRGYGAFMQRKARYALDQVTLSFHALLGNYSFNTEFPDFYAPFLEDGFEALLNSFKYPAFPKGRFQDLESELINTINQLTDEHR